MKKRVAIIGGGASGVLSAILLNNKYDVCIFERQSRILKKVIQSGNGMCNLTNEALGNIDNLKDKYNVDLKDVLLVGDRIYTDILVGVNAKVDTVMVLSGETTMDDLKKYGYRPTYIIDSIKDLPKLLNKI